MSRARFGQQRRFHEKLGRYINGGFGSRGQLLLSMLAPRLTYRLAAREIVADFRALYGDRPSPSVPGLHIEVPPYSGTNRETRSLMAALAPLSPWLAGAYVHGSVATGEEVAYSDYDALVILKREALESEATLSNLAWRLGRLRRLMFQYDPLQHHGWFVLADSELDEYCDAWFPTALFPWSRSLLPDVGRRLTIHPRDSSEEYLAAFTNLAEDTLRRIEAAPPPGDVYALKGLLSQVMLLPSLYLQARDGTALFKKFSFELAARDLPATTWQAMERISAIRARWHYDLAGPRRLLLTRSVTHRRLATRWLSPRVPEDLRRALDPEVWQSVADLIRAMQARIAARAAIR